MEQEVQEHTQELRDEAAKARKNREARASTSLRPPSTPEGPVLPHHAQKQAGESHRDLSSRPIPALRSDATDLRGSQDLVCLLIST